MHPISPSSNPTLVQYSPAPRTRVSTYVTVHRDSQLRHQTYSARPARNHPIVNSAQASTNPSRMTRQVCQNPCSSSGMLRSKIAEARTFAPSACWLLARYVSSARHRDDARWTLIRQFVQTALAFALAEFRRLVLVYGSRQDSLTCSYPVLPPTARHATVTCVDGIVSAWKPLPGPMQHLSGVQCHAVDADHHTLGTRCRDRSNVGPSSSCDH
ncbi:hypothetical protein C8Q80DRAFT_784899 [Daedaleopsis nitida]|nr:hypothetical protein C8Q80DRAFT_784899 [Daedaleopsis nitida]